MTREQAKELLPVIEAWANGQVVQVKQCGKWVDVEAVKTLDWTGPPSTYRLKPTLKRVPLGPDDVPPGSVFRCNGARQVGWAAPLQVEYNGVCFAWTSGPHLVLWECLEKDYQISRDNGKTWLPCHKEAVE